MEPLRCIELSGSSYDIGFGHGKQLQKYIVGFLNDDLAQINKLRSQPIDKSELEKHIHLYQEEIAMFCPELMEEIKGLAKGAGISIKEAVLLQIRRELIGTKSFTLVGDCSSFGIKQDQQQVSGQTIDLNGDMTNLGFVYKIKQDSEKLPDILMYSFAGLLGYMGMNSFGLSVLINMVVSDDWKVGIPPYLLVRKFLNCKTIEECIEIAEKIPRASSRSFTISDQNRQITLELTGSDYRVIKGDYLLHTNHYLHEELKKQESMNIFSYNSSVQRLKLLEEKITKTKLSLEHIKTVFADHSLYPVGICAHNRSNIHLNETVASIVMYPKEGLMYAAKGKGCKGVYQKYQLQ